MCGQITDCKINLELHNPCLSLPGSNPTHQSPPAHLNPSPFSPAFPSWGHPYIQLEGLGEPCQLPQRVGAEPGCLMFIVAFGAEKVSCL